MTKREEIREGMAYIVTTTLDCKLCQTECIDNQKLPCPEAYRIADEIMKKQDSQGLVIKVDRELPKILAECICETHPELAELGEVGDGQYHAVEDYQERLIEAGYVATEPLIDPTPDLPGIVLKSLTE